MIGLYSSDRIERAKFIVRNLFAAIDKNVNSISKDEWLKSFESGGKLRKWFDLLSNKENALTLWTKMNSDVKCDSVDRVTFPEFEQFFDKYLKNFPDDKIRSLYTNIEINLIIEDNNVKSAFKKHDDNEDGFISFAELKDALKSLNINPSESSLAEFMGIGDKDQSGKLDLEEFGRALKEFSDIGKKLI